MGMRHYDVQLIGGITKAKLPKCVPVKVKPLWVLLLKRIKWSRRSCDYCERSQRDAELNRPLFEFLGLSQFIQCKNRQKKQRLTLLIWYQQRIWFWLLTWQHGVSEKKQRGLHYAIIDEVDSLMRRVRH